MTTLADSVSEDIADILATMTIYISMHTADPGKTGASEATGVPRVAITSADYAAFEAHVATGGRRKPSSILLDFGEATADETYTHGGAWDAATAGNFLGGNGLVTPIDVVTGNPVEIPAGDFGIVGAGIA